MTLLTFRPQTRLALDMELVLQFNDEGKDEDECNEREG